MKPTDFTNVSLAVDTLAKAKADTWGALTEVLTDNTELLNRVVTLLEDKNSDHTQHIVGTLNSSNDLSETVKELEKKYAPDADVPRNISDNPIKTAAEVVLAASLAAFSLLSASLTCFLRALYSFSS